MLKHTLGSVLVILAVSTGVAGAESKIDAAVEDNRGKVYLFSGSTYVRFDIGLDRTDPGYPKPIAGNWKGLPWKSNIDAAFSHDGKIYFFKGKQVVVFDIASDKADGPPVALSEMLAGLPFASVDAAFSAKDKLYLFSKDKVARYDFTSGELDDGFPNSISAVFPGYKLTGVGAAYNAVNGKGFLFGGDKYIRFTTGNNRVDSGYPKPIEGNWSGAWQKQFKPIQIIDSTSGGA